MALTSADVQRAFQNSLGRAASQADENAFLAASQSGASDASLYAAISNSREADLNVDPVVRFYQAVFNRVPDAGGLDNATDFIRAYGASAATYQTLAGQFAQSAEFQARYGTGTSVDAAYVQALYRDILGREASATEVAGFVSGSSGYTTRGGVLYAISQSNEAIVRTDASVSAFLQNAAEGDAVYTGALPGVPTQEPTQPTTPTQPTNPGGGGGGGPAPSNFVPVAVNDTLASVTEDSGQRVITATQLLGNDTDANGDQLRINSVTSGAGGTAVLANDGNVIFTPTANFNGSADFTYTVADASSVSNVATVSFNVTAVNDAPTATGLTQTLTIAEDAAATNLFTGAVTVADIDSANVIATLTLANAAAGVLTGAGIGTLAGSATTYTITGTPGAVQTALAAVQFDSAQDFNGTTSVSVAISDGANGPQGAGNPTGSVAITVTPVNDAPLAVNDTATAREAGGTGNNASGINPTGNVLSNDTDVDTGDSMTVQGFAAGDQAGTVQTGNIGTSVAGAFGALTLAVNGTYSYVVDNTNATVEALNTGSAPLSDTFTYTIRDAAGLTSTATLTVSINGANDAAVVTSVAAASVPENTTGTVYTVTATDVDNPTGPFTYAISGGADASLFSINASTGAVSFNAAPDFEAPADQGNTNVYDLLVTASDGAATSAARAVAITVTDVNEPVFSITALDAAKAEGNTGTTPYTFTVSRTGDNTEATTLNYAVTGSSTNAASAADFGGALPGGQVSFLAGQATTTLTINVSGDTAFEQNEAFTVTLSNPPANGTISPSLGSANGEIQNDDPMPTLAYQATFGGNTNQDSQAGNYLVNNGVEISGALANSTIDLRDNGFTFATQGGGTREDGVSFSLRDVGNSLPTITGFTLTKTGFSGLDNADISVTDAGETVIVNLSGVTFAAGNTFQVDFIYA